MFLPPEPPLSPDAHPREKLRHAERMRKRRKDEKLFMTIIILIGCFAGGFVIGGLVAVISWLYIVTGLTGPLILCLAALAFTLLGVEIYRRLP